MNYLIIKIVKSKQLINIRLSPLKQNLIIFKNFFLKNNYIYIYNNFFYFIFTINDTIKIDKNVLRISFYFCNLKSFCMQNNIIFSKKIEVLKKLNMFLMSWHHYFFLKMRFKGKIYKVKRTKKKKLKLSFGRSHKTIVILKNLFLKKRKKQKHKFFFISSNLNELKQSASIIKNVRPINMFTQRGLRLSRQIIYKKIGKKSSYLNKK